MWLLETPTPTSQCWDRLRPLLPNHLPTHVLGKTVAWAPANTWEIWLELLVQSLMLWALKE